MVRDILWGGSESCTEDAGMSMRHTRGNDWDGTALHPRRARERLKTRATYNNRMKAGMPKISGDKA